MKQITVQFTIDIQEDNILDSKWIEGDSVDEKIMNFVEDELELDTRHLEFVRSISSAKLVK